MRHFSCSRMIAVLAAAGALAVAALGISESLAGEPQDDGAVQARLEAAISSYQEGALEVSVTALSEALEADLSPRQMAEAFYYRGLAYRELGKPGQAISDLTHAIALKNGLSKRRLQDAVKNRAGAYREAGIANTESVIVPEASGTGSRVAIPVPDNRLPVPVSSAGAQPRQPDPPQASAISPGSVPATTQGDFVSAIQKLVPDWP